MRKINIEVLKKIYESFAFIMPKGFSERDYWSASRFGGWVLLDTYKYLKNLKLMLIFLLKLTSKKKNKILFILDPAIYNYFKDFRLQQKHFFTNDISEGLEFLHKSYFSKYVVGIVYIGKEHTFTEKQKKRLTCPVFFFAAKSYKPEVLGYDYVSYTSQKFQSSLLLLKMLLGEILLPLKKRNCRSFLRYGKTI